MTHTSNSAVQDIVVVGHSTEAWLTACSLSARLSAAGKRITLIKTSAPCDTDSVLSVSITMQVYRFFKHVGVSFKAFSEATQFCFDLGDRYCFNKTLAPFFHANSGSNLAVAGVGLCEIISYLNLNGEPSGYHDYSLVAQLARENRFFDVDLDKPADNFLSVVGGNFVDSNCSQLFDKYAKHFPFAVIDAGYKEVNFAKDSTVSSIVVDGREIFADLFVDCTGQDRSLSRDADVIINDRTIGVIAKLDRGVNDTKRPYSQLDVSSSSITVSKPLKLGDHRLEIFPSYEGQGKPLHLTHQSKAWRGNVISMGSAYAEIGFGPVKILDWISQSVTLLADYFPKSTKVDAVKSYYNRILSAQKRSCLDLNSLSIQSVRLQYEQGLDSLDDVDYLSSVLKQTIAIYQASAHLPKLEKNEFWSREFFLSMLMGLGIYPREVSAFCALKSPSEYRAILELEKQRLAAKAKTYPYFSELLT